MRTGGIVEGIADFMAINPSDPKWHLSVDDQIKVQNMQYDMAKHPTDDARVTSALGILRDARGTELETLNVMKRTSKNKDDYDHFVGALQEALQIWQDDHSGKRPTNEEVRDIIGPQIIKTQYTKDGTYFGSYWPTTEPAFREYQRPSFADIPDSFKQTVLNDVKKAGWAEPTEAQLVQAYARVQFLKFYKQTTSYTKGPNSE